MKGDGFLKSIEDTPNLIRIVQRLFPVSGSRITRFTLFLFNLQAMVSVRKYCPVLFIPLFLSSCYHEAEMPDREWDLFEMTLSGESLDTLFVPHDDGYLIEDPQLELSLNSQRVHLKKLRVRGRTSLDYRRKSFSVNLEFPIYIRNREGSRMKRLEGFKLISLSMDYTYINNRLAFGILEKAGIMPLFFKYVELKINGNTQGIYLLIEDPEDRIREMGSEFIFRRDYHHAIRDPEYHPRTHHISQDEYEQRFKEVYDVLPLLEGEALYDLLKSRINLGQYFRKMGIDYLLQNGDYTDELFLYAMMEEGAIQYQVIPWDYDDIFQRLPHEVGRDWAVGKVFGTRSYSSHQDVLDEIGARLVFSIEDDLDYIIAIDPYLYETYTQVLADLLREVSVSEVEIVFGQIEQELDPFYAHDLIVLQSQYDRRPASRELWQQNMEEKLGFIVDRMKEMNTHLHTQDLP